MLVLLSTLAHAALPDCQDHEPDFGPPPELDESCQSEPTIGTFDPQVKWQWGSNSILPNYDEVITTPVVANLTDDNGDGLIDDRDDPDVLFVAHSYYLWTGRGVLTALNGSDGSELFSTSVVEGYTFNGGSGVAVADIDADGFPDICVASEVAGVICMEADGSTLKWAAGSASTSWGVASYPVIGDMNGDGFGEVAVGATIYDYDGTLLGEGTSFNGDLGIGRMSMMLDIDGDLELELLAGSAAYERDGTLLWQGAYDGYNGAGDLDLDGVPELIVSGDGYVTALDTSTGATLWRTAIPGGGRGGPPNIADFDGDNAPEVGVAGAANYSVYESDGTVAWSTATRDVSSNVTGSSVFDFEGDGVAEVVYADEYSLFVFSGVDGSVLMDETRHDSATWFDYPVIADLDGDGSSEILLSSCQFRTEGDWTGMTAIESASGSWMASRPIWNQHAYHISNINDDASLPDPADVNLSLHNSFRAGGLTTGPSDWQVDLSPAHDACQDECGLVPMTFSVANTGLANAEGVFVTLFRFEDELRVDVATESIGSVFSGGRNDTELVLEIEDWGPGDLWVEVGYDGTQEECDADNNQLNLGAFPGEPVDKDGDGALPIDCGGDDCDDSDPNVGPNSPEVPYDGVDNDCDEKTPDDDLDLDGFPLAQDCDDTDPAVNPSAVEVTGNGLDEDCSGTADEDCIDCEELQYRYQGGGGTGCNSTQGAPSGLWVLALAGVLLLRRRTA